ncbi:diaminopimelate epimerase-like protein [Pseudomonas sp. M47T1]|uniref:diaminopimelate epimerase n=1 Tax=Pseudomonas sp. M47T1 TaxID=1179778 RepID=UPI0002606B0A|nr:diaminopimelate epimerase [Pseudomonas sp. M47T1]EIK98286.1 diaminopimelate epimerase-like protein [Pseudomonas sp. M47T1]
MLYDARGNRYVVSSPEHLRSLGIAVPASAAQAARERSQWTSAAVSALCDRPAGARPAHAKAHRSDGLLVGPFGQGDAFDLLIVNTDGTLAERSGNGLTIFAQALSDQALVPVGQGFTLNVHHDKSDAPSPVPVSVEPARVEGVQGFWLALGVPAFGGQAVAAVGVQASRFNDRPAYTVPPLVAIDDQWQHSVFVRIGNPHCVTWLHSPAALPSMAQLRAPVLDAQLTTIAFAQDGGQGHGLPCPAGINLQWAAWLGPQQLAARVFERGEGATESSGTSATAVACAAWQVGLVQAGQVRVQMPGGTAPLKLVEERGELIAVQLFGTASLQP